MARIPGEPEALFLGVWGASPEDVWFVGGRSGPVGGVIAHFDGVDVRATSTPLGPTLWWIWGLPLGPTWACGQAGRVLVLRDGRWHAERTGLPADAVLWGLWGSSREDLWAVGGSASLRGPKGILVRSAGDGAWRQVRDPDLPTDTNLFKVWGAGPADVHVVGEAGVALHFDGADLRRVETGTAELLFTVHGQPTGPILAVGGTVSGVALLWEDGRWVDAGAPPSLPPFNGVYVGPDGAAVVTGQRGVVLSRSAEGEWTRHRGARAGGFAADTLHAIWRGSELWAVGGDLQNAGAGLIATSRRPLPAFDPTPAPALDGGVLDAAVDAAVDLGPDAAPDAAPEDLGMMEPVCGDGRIQGDEACDDGGRVPGDGCDPDCQLECGNGRLDEGEACDDGFADDCGTCDATCSGPGAGPGQCGDGDHCPEFEVCDDGFLDACGSCDPFCAGPGAGPGRCGDGEVCREFEECDDGGNADGDGCDPLCRLQCGNPVADAAAGVRLEWTPRCPQGRVCLGLAEADFLLYCTFICETADDCGPDFGARPCCLPAGPQLVDNYCIPDELLPQGCPERE